MARRTEKYQNTVWYSYRLMAISLVTIFSIERQEYSSELARKKNQ